MGHGQGGERGRKGGERGGGRERRRGEGGGNEEEGGCGGEGLNAGEWGERGTG